MVKKNKKKKKILSLSKRLDRDMDKLEKLDWSFLKADSDKIKLSALVVKIEGILKSDNTDIIEIEKISIDEYTDEVNKVCGYYIFMILKNKSFLSFNSHINSILNVNQQSIHDVLIGCNSDNKQVLQIIWTHGVSSRSLQVEETLNKKRKNQ